MRIFKFGGASVKDADGVKNVVSVLRTVGFQKIRYWLFQQWGKQLMQGNCGKNYFENEKSYSAVFKK